MAFKHGSKAKVYANGYDLSGFLKQFSVSAKADAHEASTFGDTAKDYIAGLKDATLSAEGVYDGATGAIDAILEAALGDDSSIWTYFPQGESAVGDDGYGFDAVTTGYEVSTPVNDVAVISTEAQGKTGAERVDSLHPLGAETVTGNGTSLDNTASSTNGGAAYLQVTAASGTTPSLTVKIQHSTDNSTWVDLITFTAVTAANQAERKAVTGNVNRYIRATWTISGTGPNFTFSVAFGRK